MGKEIRKGKEVEEKNEGEKKEGKIGKRDENGFRGRGKTEICERQAVHGYSYTITHGDCKL
jgi:hypothetical protein